MISVASEARSRPIGESGSLSMPGKKMLSRTILRNLWRIVWRQTQMCRTFHFESSRRPGKCNILRDPSSPTWDDCTRDSLALFCPQAFVEGLDAYWVGLADDRYGHGLDNCRAGTAITPTDAVAGECKKCFWLRATDNRKLLLRLHFRRRQSSPA